MYFAFHQLKQNRFDDISKTGISSDLQSGTSQVVQTTKIKVVVTSWKTPGMVYL